MRKTCLLFILVSLAAASSHAKQSSKAASQEKVCTDSDGNRALDLSDSLKSWTEAYNFFKKYAKCDDGAIAEGISDSVARLLAKNWKQLPELGRLVSKDESFENFIIRHLDETDNYDDLKTIGRNARLSCPTGQERLCKRIGGKINELFSEPK